MVRDPQTSRPIGTEEAQGRGIVEMLSPVREKSKTLSDLDDEQVGVLSLLETIGDELGLDSITKFTEEFRQHRISRFRLGRREIGGILTFSGYGLAEGKKARSVRDLFAGLR